LVAAKTLLHNAPTGEFKVSIFDSQSAIGGLWPSSKTDSGRQVHPLMVTNQSRHTMQLSDLAWEPHVPQLPQAWMVGQYLERYNAQYLAGRSDFELNLNSHVTSASQKDGGWSVVIEADGKKETSQYDYLLVASGYFGKPNVPAALSEEASIPVIHSSQYRDLKSLLSNGSPNGGKILVVGGQMSGVEIAGTVATHLSSEVNSPDASSIPNVDKYSIQHVIQRPVYVFPLHTALEVWNPDKFLRLYC
jgi:cation diffusion facilitator CzcD-associated flavoprotein CzcO